MATASPADYGYLRTLVQGHSQNVLDSSRDYLFDSRLAKLLRNQGMSRLEELVRHLRTHRDPALERAIAEAMTINETSFFRDQRPFELLRTSLLPQLIEARRSTQMLRLWSAGCSTGQEALSLAMLMLEHFPQIHSWNIRIEATDISAEVVERARAGRYHRIEVNRGLPAPFLVKYFEPAGEDWIVREEARAMCSFRQANLCAPVLPFSQPFDVILLRNVMLYFAPDTRRVLLENLYALTARDGVLMLGVGEQTTESARWMPVVAGGTCYYKPAGKAGDRD
ncbi:MAG TPA: protein-glutamate O-methyltransferase CheR [Terracidiphilus sp.]|jgi:chemotaxis protein methyltransferase CheR